MDSSTRFSHRVFLLFVLLFWAGRFDPKHFRKQEFGHNDFEVQVVAKGVLFVHGQSVHFDGREHKGFIAWFSQ